MTNRRNANIISLGPREISAKLTQTMQGHPNNQAAQSASTNYGNNERVNNLSNHLIGVTLE
jgi:hypothetical protein